MSIRRDKRRIYRHSLSPMGKVNRWLDLCTAILAKQLGVFPPERPWFKFTLSDKARRSIR